MSYPLSFATIKQHVSNYFTGPWNNRITAKAVYDVAMAAFAWKQHTSPQYANSILSFQRIAMIGDVICLGLDYYELYQELKIASEPVPQIPLNAEAAQITEVEGTEQATEVEGTAQTTEMVVVHEKKWYQSSLFLILSGLTVGAVSAFAVSKINQSFRPVINLSTIVKMIARDEEMSSLTFKWYVPQIQKLSQWLYLNRIFLNLGLALISSHKVSHLVSALFQSFSLFNISHLHWISVETPLKETFKNKQGHESTLFGRVALSFFIPSATQGPIEGDPTLHDHLQFCIHSIYQYMKRCFDNKNWRLTTHLGDRRLELTLLPPQLESCICGLSPTLTEAKAGGSHSVYGSVPIDVVTKMEVLKTS